MKKYIKRLSWLIALDLSIAIILALAQLSLAYGLGGITDSIVDENRLKFLTSIAVAACSGILFGIFTWLSWKVSAIIKRNFSDDFQHDLAVGIFYQDYTSFSEKSSSDYSSTLQNDVSIIADKFIGQILNLLESIIVFFAAGVYLFFLSPLLAITIIGSSLILVIAPLAFGKGLKERMSEYSESKKSFLNTMENSFSCFPIFFIFKNISKAETRILSQGKVENKKSERLQSYNGVSYATIATLAAISQILGFAIGGILAFDGYLTVGTLIIGVQLSNSIVSPFNQGLNAISNIISTRPVREKLLKMIIFPSRKATYNIVADSQNTISLKDVSFSYGNTAIIVGLSYTFKKDSKTVIKGPSGSGKSTLIKIILGLLEPKQGTVSYCNDAKDFISVVFQEPYLLNDTIKNNICFGENFSKEEFEHALDASGLKSFIYSLPQKENTVIEDKANNISGGQRQRICIARALIRKPEVLVLDEAFSAVEPSLKKFIRQNVYRTVSTVIEINHDEEKDAQDTCIETIVLQNGKLEHC